MAFFEDLGKKISKMGQTTVQKTKEFADIAKLNSSISEEERKLKETYLQIGKQYVELYGEKEESDFSELILSIRAGQEKISEYQAEIEKIRGVMRCEQCGAEIAYNSGFCSNCGSKIEMKQELIMEAVDISADEGAETEESMEGTVVEEGAVEEKTLCKNCQAVLPEGAAFCAECGTKVEG